MKVIRATNGIIEKKDDDSVVFHPFFDKKGRLIRKHGLLYSFLEKHPVFVSNANMFFASFLVIYFIYTVLIVLGYDSIISGLVGKIYELISFS